MKKKILIVIPSLEIGGGAERVAASLTKKLAKKYTVFIITFYNFQKTYPYEGFYHSLNLKLKTWRRIFLPINIFKVIQPISPDLIISFLAHTNILIILIKILFRMKIPLIICNHTNLKMAYKDRKKYINFFVKILYRLNWIKKIITISKENHASLVNDYNIKKSLITTIHNGIDLQEIRELSNAEVNYRGIFENKEIIKFITIGRLHELKRHRDLIIAFSRVKSEIINAKLFIIGDGSLRKELEELIKQKDLENDIILLGLVENPYSYLSKSDIFVLSSKYEVFPMVLLEALACGLPIISTNCKTGPQEILNNGQYGILTKVMDSDELAEKMIYLAKNEDFREKYAKKSLERAKIFDINNISEEWFDLIDSYIG
ncbi:MAG: glycosyltransferase [Promethearchaeota archaeon]